MKLLLGDTHVGLTRKENQDRFLVGKLSETLSYGVLCDGMGGENGGETASQITVDYVSGVLSKSLIENMNESSIKAILFSAIYGANARVYETAEKTASLRGMGTTIIASVFSGEGAYCACVGDSRIYCVTAESETQLSHDHTIIQEWLDKGKINEDAALVHPERHSITRAVGVAESIEIDFIYHPIGAGDIMLLCSDGLYNCVAAGSLYPLLKKSLRMGNLQPLIEKALEGGGTDNITAIIAQ